MAAGGSENVIDRGDLTGRRLDQAEGNWRGARADRIRELLQGDGVDGDAAVGMDQPREEVRSASHAGRGGSP
jgi:hypothetical protein